MDAALLARWMPAGADVDVYLVGPKAFMQAVHAHAVGLGVPPARIHYEFFGPKEALTAPA